MPAEDGLGRGAVVSLGNLSDRVLVEQLALSERTPGLGGDVVLVVEPAELLLDQARVKLDLVTAGVSPVSSMIRSRCSTRKLETPIERAARRPDSSMSVCQVSR